MSNRDLWGWRRSWRFLLLLAAPCLAFTGIWGCQGLPQSPPAEADRVFVEPLRPPAKAKSSIFFDDRSIDIERRLGVE